ncbi:5-bromo-4-chloroindolyl phosphate hydrolysis family protein [Fictibacillus barbaricus]|uniref:5-bromo-4-chloroindolyl phosphate hydrolysis family protein n=1 Tax=Fictibacillus barbaricus TaxID=182136 RepID=A0ABS2ZA75_9BACL|nr:5-bromo-4-chloroindolyl phosphate hydrolysis family protein [Fictibacillus barbaricus]MBN3544341.1 5-bromo-4-chloroindolyl phosphate hydrolysis family protein [Fictibacillus barbaricus]GGB67611.1 protein XpaC [Fictibacillus barbaricus]
MNGFLAFFIRMFVAIPASAGVWLASIIGYDQTYLMSSGIAIAGGAAAYTATSLLQKQRFLSNHHLSRREYKYIRKNLDEAQPKISRLQKALLSVRDLPTLKQRVDLVRVVRRIQSLVQKEPRRFYQAEQFYFSHLDSAVELTEKYMFLSAQPRKTKELTQSLVETKRTLDELKEYIEKDLYHVLSNDIDDLHYEIDVAKYSIKSLKESQSIKKAGDIHERK